MLPLFASMTVSSTDAVASGDAFVSFNGDFSTSSSASVVESPLLTADVPGGSSGNLAFQNFIMTGVVKLYSNVNGAGYSLQAEDGNITLADGETLQVRITGATSGESLAFDLIDIDTGQVIESVIMVCS